MSSDPSPSFQRFTVSPDKFRDVCVPPEVTEAQAKELTTQYANAYPEAVRAFNAMKRLLVTVFADASLRGPIAGCGYWFKSEETTGHGTHTFPAANINVGELGGLVAGVKAAIAAHPGRDLDFVLQCDNLAALGALQHLLPNARQAKTSPTAIPNRNRRRIHAEETALAVELQGIVRASMLWLKHVKGHTRDQTKRAWVNSRTDHLSRQAHRG